MRRASHRPGGAPGSARWTAVFAALSVFVALLCLECADDETSVCRPEVPGGRIQGTVRMGDVAPVGFVRASRIPEAGRSAASIDVRPAPRGAYGVDVPAGRYIVAFCVEGGADHAIYEYSAGGLRYGDAPPDTVQVDAERSPVTLDFPLATVHVRAALSPTHDGKSYGGVRLLRGGAQSLDRDRGYLSGAIGDIEGGVLDLSLYGVLPGDYRVEILAGEGICVSRCFYGPYAGERIWVPGVRDSSRSDWVHVPVDRTVEVEVAIPNALAVVEGRITGAWQEAGAEDPPQVALFDPDSNAVVGPMPAREDGSYRIEVLLPGPVKLWIEQNGVEQWYGGASFAEASILSLEEGRTVSGIDLVQSGLVLETPHDLGSLHCTLYDPTSHRLLHTFYGTGHVIPNLRPGTFLLRIEPGGGRGHFWWLDQWVDRAGGPEDARPITISREGEVVSVPLVIERGGVVRGSVQAGSTNGMMVYLVRAHETEIWSQEPIGSTSPQFEFVGVPDGMWEIGVLPRVVWYPAEPPEGTVWYPGTVNRDQAEAIEIANHAEASVQIVMP